LRNHIAYVLVGAVEDGCFILDLSLPKHALSLPASRAVREVNAEFLRLISKNVLPPQGAENYFGKLSYNELFDVVEYFYGKIKTIKQVNGSEPIGTTAESRNKFRYKINQIIRRFEDGFELCADGEIIHMKPLGMDKFVDPSQDSELSADIKSKIAAAVKMFYSLDTSPDFTNKKAAIKLLADEFELIRPWIKSKSLLKEDEKKLFDYLNNFGIRHNRIGQMIDYEKDIFYDWIFGSLLSALYAFEKILERERIQKDEEPT